MWFVIFDELTGELVVEGATLGPTPPPGAALAQLPSAPGAGKGWDAATLAYVTDVEKAATSRKRREAGAGGWATIAAPKLAIWLDAQRERALAYSRGQDTAALDARLAVARAEVIESATAWKIATA